jgi:hypothetical protein
VRISTKIVTDIETGRVLMRESYEYDGPLELNCGATSEQKAAEAAQANLANEMTKDYATVFGQNQEILKSLQTALQPIIAAGPNQQGFSSAELSNLQDQAKNLSAQGAQQAEVAASAKAATAGGGSAAIPSGATEQIDAMVNNSAAQNLANTEAGITAEDYATGRQNFFTAEGALAGQAGQLENPATAAGGAASTANTDWMNSATQIQQANDAWMGIVGGLVGSIGGAALGPHPK